MTTIWDQSGAPLSSVNLDVRVPRASLRPAFSGILRRCSLTRTRSIPPPISRASLRLKSAMRARAFIQIDALDLPSRPSAAIKHFPLFSIFHGTHDILFVDTRKLIARLDQEGIAVDFFEFPHMGDVPDVGSAGRSREIGRTDQRQVTLSTRWIRHSPRRDHAQRTCQLPSEKTASSLHAERKIAQVAPRPRSPKSAERPSGE